MVLLHCVEYDVCTGTAIIDVAQNVQLVDGQTLDNVTQSNNEIVCTTCRDNSVDNDADIGCLIVVIGTLVQQFLDNIGKLFGQRLTYLRACVF